MESLFRRRVSMPMVAAKGSRCHPLPFGRARRHVGPSVARSAPIDGPVLPPSDSASSINDAPTSFDPPTTTTAVDPATAAPEGLCQRADTLSNTTNINSNTNRDRSGRGDKDLPNTTSQRQPKNNHQQRRQPDGSNHPSQRTQPSGPPPPPVYAEAYYARFPSFPTRHPKQRPRFLGSYSVPEGRTFNVNSFLGRGDPLEGRYHVTTQQYPDFLAKYHAALMGGYQMFLTENYHAQVFKYFVELDWDWDTDLAVVMGVTPQLIDLISRVVGDFYSFRFPNVLSSIRTPFKVHLNYPQLLTTELLACMCRDRILDACRERFGQRFPDIDWERLVDFPHGSLRLLGSRKAPHMDSDPDWVQEKAYYPARLVDGKWMAGRLTVGLLGVMSIFPLPRQVEQFERSPAYVEMVFGDMEAVQRKMEERRQRRLEKIQEREAQQRAGWGQDRGSGPRLNPARALQLKISQLPPGSGTEPLVVALEVKPDETVSLHVHIKSRFRSGQTFRHTKTKGPPAGVAGTGPTAAAGLPGAAPPEAIAGGDAAGVQAAASTSAAADEGVDVSVSTAPTPTSSLRATPGSADTQAQLVAAQAALATGTSDILEEEEEEEENEEEDQRAEDTATTLGVAPLGTAEEPPTTGAQPVASAAGTLDGVGATMVEASVGFVPRDVGAREEEEGAAAAETPTAAAGRSPGSPDAEADAAAGGPSAAGEVRPAVSVSW